MNVLQNENELEANIISKSEYSLCSNFALTPFTFGKKRFASAEAFIHYIKYPPKHPHKEAVRRLSGGYAKRKGVTSDIREYIQNSLDRQELPSIYWQNKIFEYRTPTHFKLIKEALKAKFLQNKSAMESLISTQNKTIVHNIGKKDSPYTSLPSGEFTRILTELRQEFGDT